MPHDDSERILSALCGCRYDIVTNLVVHLCERHEKSWMFAEIPKS